MNGVYPTKYYDEKQLDVDKFDGKFFSYYAYMQAVELCKLERSSGGTVESVRIQKDELVQEEGRVMKTRGSNMIRVAAAAPSADKVFDVVEEMPQFAGGTGSDAGQFLDKVQVRENMNETAFFYPALESDNNGNALIISQLGLLVYSTVTFASSVPFACLPSLSRKSLLRSKLCSPC